MITRCIAYFYPDLKREEQQKFGLLSGIFFLIVGTYWLLRCLKDTIFMKIAFPEHFGWLPHQGRLFQPVAKLWSPFVVLALVLIYSKLVDICKKHQLFYLICGFYALLFGFIAMVLFGQEMYGDQVVGKQMLASAGWLSYFLIESFGSLVVGSLFWSFTNSITDETSAKRGFPLIIAFAQFGAVIGSSLLLFSQTIGIVWLLALSSILVALVIPCVYYFMKVTPPEQLIGDKHAARTEHCKEGFFEGFISGLTLLLTRPYLMGIFVISTFYEIIQQVFGYMLKSYASIAFVTPEDFGWFLGVFGIITNVLAMLVALLGTRHIIKQWGLRISLLVYPISFATIIALILLHFIFGASSDATVMLYVLSIAMAVIKGLSYAVNNPVKEMMYIPTSKDAKFKSKGWIDMFGGRFAKAGGGQITSIFKNNLSELMVYGSLASFGLIGVWIIAAIYVGNKNRTLVQHGKIVE